MTLFPFTFFSRTTTGSATLPPRFNFDPDPDPDPGPASGRGSGSRVSSFQTITWPFVNTAAAVSCQLDKHACTGVEGKVRW